jgi:hypothetical protein
MGFGIAPQIVHEKQRITKWQSGTERYKNDGGSSFLSFPLLNNENSESSLQKYQKPIAAPTFDTILAVSNEGVLHI